MSAQSGQRRADKENEARYLAIVNPAAGNGRCRRFSHATLGRVRRAGIDLVVSETTRRGEASEIARKAYQEGFRNFIAVGGDGTSFEILNGLFPRPAIPRDAWRSVSCRWVPEIHFLETSLCKALNTR
jgi:diacylglycerol kinase family enzyme